MKKAFDDYTLLAGGSGLKGSLWKGPDHLLVIEAGGFLLPFREIYRRIDYKNIQALTLTETRAYIWKALLITLPLMIIMAIAISIISSRGFHEAGWALSVAVLTLSVLLAMHLIMGRTCVCTLQTAVLTLRLKPLKRKAKSTAILEELGDLCRHHQGPMPDELPAAAGPSPMLFGNKPEWLGSILVRNTLIMALLWGVLLVGELFVDNVTWLILDIMLLPVVFFMAIPSLVKVSRARSPGSLQVSLWCLLATTLLGAGVFFGMFFASAVSLEKVKGTMPADYFYWMSSLSFGEARAGAWFIIGTGVIALFLGLLGLPSSLKRKTLAPQLHQAPPPSGVQD